MATEIVKLSGNRSRAPHLLILPYPAQGHINPMLQFAKRLVSKGVDATLAITVFIANSLDGAAPNSSVHIETFSDGYDQGGYAEAESAESYLETLRTAGSRTLSELIQRLQERGRPVDAVVYDGFIPWGLDVAKRFGLKAVLFFTQTCAVNTIYYHFYKGSIKLPLSEQRTISLPGLPLLQSYEAPSYLQIYGSYPAWFYTVVNQFSNIDQADWILFNNFYELEKEEVDRFSKLWKVGVGTIGPTLPSAYLDKRIDDDKDYGLNLFKPDRAGCISWLSDKHKGSVVYVSFGSMAEVSQEQTAELAFGLKQANCYFLWVVRASEERKLPEGFTAETRGGKGLVVNWSPQLEVLAHEAVGCFVTHCGLNSIFEGVCLGVPMVGIPQWTDQPVNAKYVEEIWGMGIRAMADEEGIVRREVVAKCIREVIEGEKGKEIKVRAGKWKKLARDVIDEGGSSDKNIDEFVLKLFNFSV